MFCGNNARVEDLDDALDNSAGYADRSWWMVECEYIIYQKVNYLLDRSYFRGYSQSVRTNVQMMSKADNYNEYNYDQTSGKNHIR